MKAEQAYDLWANQYDTNENKTRDVEGLALRKMLNDVTFSNCLEIGCGTGKNTEWLVTRSQQITAVDLSYEMLARAKEKINSTQVEFVKADINEQWTFRKKRYDLVTFSLILEHISILDHVFKVAADALNPGGFIYIGELHPFKQYTGSKARFETAGGTQMVTCFNHHTSDFLNASKQFGLKLIELDEHFDNGSREEIPRILTMILKKI